jgi:hypothetical protein
MKNHIRIEGKRWFHKSDGNICHSVHSVKVWVDDEPLGYIPFRYGYESHYQQTAAELLIKNGYFKDYADFCDHKRKFPDNFQITVQDDTGNMEEETEERGVN